MQGIILLIPVHHSPDIFAKPELLPGNKIGDTPSQKKVKELWPKVNSDNLLEMTNFDEYQEEFLRLFGFGISGVNYDKEVDPVNPF